MKTLYLHVGMHKAGSTSIQCALNKDRLQLIEQGLYFPLTATEGNTRAHQNIAWELIRDERFVPEDGSLADLHDELTQEKPENVIISSEGFTSLDTRPGFNRYKKIRELTEAQSSKPNRYRRLREFADSLGYRIVTVGFVREYVSCLNSAYTQQVKTFKHARSFADHVEEQRDNERWSYEFVFAGWEAVSDEVICLPNGEDNVRSLYEVLGVEYAEDQEAKRRNSGVGPKTIECSRILFRALEARQHGRVGQQRSRKNKDKEFQPPHKIVKRMARLYNWNEDLFWGFGRELAREVQASLIARDQRFLDKHQIKFGDSFEKKRKNDFILENALGSEREEFQDAMNDIIAELGLEEAA